jgi:hypothetical protein
MRRLLNTLRSLELGLWLLGLVCAALAAGSLALKGDSAAAINALPLFTWLRETPAALSWWLWLAVALLALLVLNTLLCSADALLARRGRTGLAALVAPQLVHAGFLLIVAAHLLSAMGASMERFPVMEGSVLRLPDGRPLAVTAITARLSPMGMPLGISSELAIDPANPDLRVVISPNHPWFSGGYGVYIKQAERFPHPRALLEVHHEPGAAMALAGAILFTIGTALVLWLRSKRGEFGRASKEPDNNRQPPLDRINTDTISPYEPNI